MTSPSPEEARAAHAFRFRSHNAEHSGRLDDEVAEWLSALLVVIHDDPAASVVALKAAVRALAFPVPVPSTSSM